MATPPNRFQDTVDRVTSGSSRFEIVHTTHTTWPLPSGTRAGDGLLEVSVLDSSFNPPTLAHAALASLGHASSARLLLLSIRNSDKTLKPGDASPAQRLEMMVLLANELVTNGGGPVAVGTIDEPTFVGKSTVVLEHLASSHPTQPLRLTFLMGWDTLIRVFAPRYYPSLSSMHSVFQHFFGPEGSRILCARRPSSSSSEKEEKEYLESPEVSPYIAEGKVKMVDLEKGMGGVSSTEVRGGGEGCSEAVVGYMRERGLYAWKRDA
ncbi:hypothetical protein BDV93DRAFT_522410 [Ceratobasidium sp. AG-I]|nr:hypothetical protein BDV93DRAFT_522410 [Ceratobasidium sp. AG-I]